MAAPDGAGGVSLGTAELLADAERPGGWVLLVDRIRQSYVDLDDPTYLDFEYSQVCADVLAALPSPPPAPLAVTHVGGGACTLARYIAATRPGSSQIVLEPDTAVTALVRAKLPLPRNARIRIRPVGGRAGIGELRNASADVVVLDAFLGGRVPGELTTLEFLTDVARVLRPGGVLLANIADGPPLTYTARVAATMRAALTGPGDGAGNGVGNGAGNGARNGAGNGVDNNGVGSGVAAIADPAVLKRRRFGNVVLAASRAPLPLAALRAAAARAPFPRSVTSTLGRGVAPLRDADPQRSPAPPEDSWRVEIDWPDDVDA